MLYYTHARKRTHLVRTPYPVQDHPAARVAAPPLQTLPFLPPTIAQVAAQRQVWAGGGSGAGTVAAAAAVAPPPPPQPQPPPPPPLPRRIAGGYAVIDPATLEAIRSGKADDCAERKGGHRQCARQRNRSAGSSQLYTLYPSKELTEEENSPTRKGWFEDLHFGIFVGFDRQNPKAVDFLTQDARDGGLLNWTGAIDELRSRHGHKSAKIKEDQLVLVEYLVELVCDLLLNPANCVSNSAGFERFLKEFGSSADGDGDTTNETNEDDD
jgi:hypothetical protein